MVGGADGPRVADSAQDSGLILASATPVSRHPRPCGGAASLVGWGLFLLPVVGGAIASKS